MNDNSYREEIVAKIAINVSSALEEIADLINTDKGYNFKDFDNVVDNIANKKLKQILLSSKDQIHEHSITIQELMEAVGKINSNHVFECDEATGITGADKAIGNSFVQERNFKITEEDCTVTINGKNQNALSIVFSSNNLTAQWISALRDTTVIPAFIKMTEEYGMLPAGQVTTVSYEEPGHALCEVKTIFEPALNDKKDSKVESIIREVINDSRAAIEMWIIEKNSLIAAVTYINGTCIEMRYFKIIKNKISKTPCFISSNKEENDAWLERQRVKFKDNAEKDFINHVNELVEARNLPKVVTEKLMGEIEKLAASIRKEAEEIHKKEKEQHQKPKTANAHSSRIKFSDN